jgi:hypothetical protein
MLHVTRIIGALLADKSTAASRKWQRKAAHVLEALQLPQLKCKLTFSGGLSNYWRARNLCQMPPEDRAYRKYGLGCTDFYG